MEGVQNDMLSGIELTALFKCYLNDLYFPRLNCLELRNWVMPETGVRSLLSKHALTLRELRLIECHVDGDMHLMGKCAGQNLALTGIRIEDEAVLDPIWFEDAPESIGTLAPYDEPLWLAGRENLIVREDMRPGEDRLE